MCQHVSSRTKKLNPTPELARTPTLHMQSDSGNSKRRISFNPSSGPINVGGLIGRTDSTLAGVLIRTTSAPDVLCCNILEHIVKHDIYVNFRLPRFSRLRSGHVITTSLALHSP